MVTTTDVLTRRTPARSTIGVGHRPHRRSTWWSPSTTRRRDLEPSVLRLYAHLQPGFPFTLRITIADNASTDGTWAHRPTRLAASLPGVEAVHLDAEGPRPGAAPGVGGQRRHGAGLHGRRPVHRPRGAAAAGRPAAVRAQRRRDRLPAVPRRPGWCADPKRELISRCYNLLLRTTLATRFSDAQCGFKAIRADRARDLLPLVEDTGWFFDTELLVLAERAGLRIHEVPVDWVDDPDSRVDIVATARGRPARHRRGSAAAWRPAASPLSTLRSAHRPSAVGRAPPGSSAS